MSAGWGMISLGSISMVMRYKEIRVHVVEPLHEKTINFGSNQVRHKPGCTVTEDG